MQGDDSNCDRCHTCRKRGTLFCCDECPRAFHGKCLPNGTPTSTTWKCHMCTQDNHPDIVSEEPSRRELQPLLMQYTNGNNNKEIRAILKLYDIVKFLMKYDFGKKFSSPVDTKLYPAYLKFVDEPMDLGTIAKYIRNDIRKGIYFDAVVTSTNVVENATLPELKNSSRFCDFDVCTVASASMNSEDMSVIAFPEPPTEGVPTVPMALSRQCELTPTLMKEDVGIARKEPLTGPRTVSKSSFRHIKKEAAGNARPGQTIKDGSNLFYIAKEDDKVSEIASKFKVSVEDIIKLNKRHHPSLERQSKLKAKTIIKFPCTDDFAGSYVCIGEKNDLVGLNRAVFSIIKDIELVWHNCFLFNEENSWVYRMGMVQRKKFLVLVNSSLAKDLDYTVGEGINEYTAWVQQRDNLGDLNSVGRCIQAGDTNDVTPTSNSKRHKSYRNELVALPFPMCCICKERNVEDEDNLMTFPTCRCETKLIESISSFSDSQENIQIIKYKYQIVHQGCYATFIEKTQEVFECDYRGRPDANPRCSVVTKCPVCRIQFSPRTLDEWLKSGFGATELKESIRRTIRRKNCIEREPSDALRRQEYLPGELQRELQEKEICFRQQQEEDCRALQQKKEGQSAETLKTIGKTLPGELQRELQEKEICFRQQQKEDRQQEEDRRALQQKKECQSAETLKTVDEKKSLRFSSTDQHCFVKTEMKNSTNTSRKEAKDVIDLTAEDSNEEADKMSTSQEVIDLTNDDIPRSVQFHCKCGHQEESSVQINESGTRNAKPKRPRLSKEEADEIDFMRSLPSDITKRFLDLGFAKYDEQWNPVIFLSPFDIPRSELRYQSIAEYRAARGSKPLRHLVYWYGQKIFSLVNETDTVSQLEGVAKEYDQDPIDIYRKKKEGKELTPDEERLLNGLESFAKAAHTPKQERWNRIRNEWD